MDRFMRYTPPQWAYRHFLMFLGRIALRIDAAIWNLSRGKIRPVCYAFLLRQRVQLAVAVMRKAKLAAWARRDMSDNTGFICIDDIPVHRDPNAWYDLYPELVRYSEERMARREAQAAKEGSDGSNRS